MEKRALREWEEKQLDSEEEQERESKCKLNSWQLIYILSAVGNKMSMSEEVASQA